MCKIYQNITRSEHRISAVRTSGRYAEIDLFIHAKASLLSQVFTLDSPDTFFIAYDPSQSHLRLGHLDFIAEQIATLCATIGEYPTIRYRSENERMLEFAHAVQQKLNQYKADDATMGEVNRSE